MRKARAHDFRMVRACHVMIRGTRENSTTEMPNEKLQENKKKRGMRERTKVTKVRVFTLSLSLTLSLSILCKCENNF